ncbi:hypothetical protein FQA47_004398 [Oryzias melastigma]|uniref:Uncharacterized protein n=1 Tax=Oryzias melastigma TaxID=30732 RepID=A0A834FMG0_ORYME|nr:hypothetical protein FQA47_004398 [Oryzias melastigma]
MKTAEKAFNSGMGWISMKKTLAVAQKGDLTVRDRTVAELSPRAWVEALQDLQRQELGEEEENRCKELTDEAFGSMFGEAETQEGSEGKDEDKEPTELRDPGGHEREEKNVCSLSGWHSDASSVNVEPPTPGRSVSSDLLNRRESQENSSESVTSSSRGESGKSQQNGDNLKLSRQDASSESSNGKKEDGAPVLEKKTQHGGDSRKSRRKDDRRSGDKKHS